MSFRPHLFSDLKGGQVTVRLGVVAVHGYRDLERLSPTHPKRTNEGGREGEGGDRSVGVEFDSTTNEQHVLYFRRRSSLFKVLPGYLLFVLQLRHVRRKTAVVLVLALIVFIPAFLYLRR